MRIKLKLALLALLLCVVAQNIYADGILTSWSSRDVQGINDQLFNAAKKLTVDEIHKKNIEVTSWPDAFLLMVGATQQNEDKGLMKVLITQLTNKAKTELKSTSRLIIWERITSGEILFEGKGLQISDDLFTVAGRANWMLRNLAKKNFGYVRPSTSDEELIKLQQKWSHWLSGEQVDEYQNPYATSIEGLEEIRSLEAVEALIVSLSPTSEKESLAKNCRERVSRLGKPPDDSDEPVVLCNPDSYTNRYLTVVTGIKDRHDYAWWKKWWDTSKNLLAWDRENGTFDVKK